MNNPRCPYCGAAFSHRPPNSETVLWECGSWENKPQGLGDQAAACRVQQLEIEVERLENGELSATDGAIVFSSDGEIRLLVPKMDDWDIVPAHIIKASAWMAATTDAELSALVERRFDEAEEGTT